MTVHLMPHVAIGEFLFAFDFAAEYVRPYEVPDAAIHPPGITYPAPRL